MIFGQKTEIFPPQVCRGVLSRTIISSKNRVVVCSGRRPILPPKKSIRGKVSGWNFSVARSLRSFLGKIDWQKFAALGAYSIALNLTYKTMPSSAAASALMLDRYIRMLKRRGLVACVWVMEYQLRGVPHFHILSVFKSPIDDDTLIKLWCRVSKSCGSLSVGQKIVKIYDAKGFAKYQSKHLTKSLGCAQRVGFPKDWIAGGGRVWGHRGAVPLVACLMARSLAALFSNSPPIDLNNDSEYYELRRLCRRFGKADTRSRAPLLDCDYRNNIRYGQLGFKNHFLHAYIDDRNGKIIRCKKTWTNEFIRRRSAGKARLSGDISPKEYRLFKRTGQFPLYDKNKPDFIYNKKTRASFLKFKSPNFSAMADLSQESIIAFHNFHFSPDDFSRGSFSATDRIAKKMQAQKNII